MLFIFQVLCAHNSFTLLHSSQVKSTITVDQNIRGPRSPYNMTSLVPIIMPPNTNPFKGNQSSRVFLSQNRCCLCWFQNYSSQKGEKRGYILAGPKLNTCRSLSTLSCWRALLYFHFYKLRSDLYAEWFLLFSAHFRLRFHKCVQLTNHHHNQDVEQVHRAHRSPHHSSVNPSSCPQPLATLFL